MVNFFKKLFAKKDLIDEQLSCIEGLEKDLQKAQHDLYWIKHNEHKTREESNTAKAINRELVQVMLKNNIAPQQIYETIAPFGDPDGFELCNIAEKLTRVSVIHTFSAEDNLGYFENADGFEILCWLESAAYGDIEWEIVGAYGRAVQHTIRTDSEEYKQYRHTLFDEAIKKILNIDNKINKEIKTA